MTRRKTNLVYFMFSVESYVKSMGRTDLLDLLVQPASEDVTMDDVEDLRPSKRKVVYAEVVFFFIPLSNLLSFM